MLSAVAVQVSSADGTPGRAKGYVRVEELQVRQSLVLMRRNRTNTQPLAFVTNSQETHCSASMGPMRL